MKIKRKYNKFKFKKFLFLNLFIILFLTNLLLNSCNPFAPKLENNNGSLSDSTIITDQTTIDGVFQNFRYAYNFKDTLVYSNLLTDDFIFVFRDYDVGVDVSWGKGEDMLTTSRLFQGSQYLELVWNYPTIFGDTLTMDTLEVSRGFSLTVVFSTSDMVPLQGRASFELIRREKYGVWRISKWRDLSNF